MQIQPNAFTYSQVPARPAASPFVTNVNVNFNYNYFSMANSFQSLNQGWQSYLGDGVSNYQMNQILQMIMGFVQAMSSQLFSQTSPQVSPSYCECHHPAQPQPQPEKPVTHVAEPKPQTEPYKPQPATNKAEPKPEPKPYKPEPKPEPPKEPAPFQLQPRLPGQTEAQMEIGTKEWAQREYEANKQYANGIVQSDEGEWQVDWIGSPVVLDLDGDGKLDLTGKDGDKIEFDLLGDGTRLKTEWLKKGTKDGLLVADFDGNGKIDSGRELMRKTGINGEQSKYFNGWEKVREVFDANDDGKINGKELEGLQVWVDSNGDGETDEGELRSLASQGVTEIVVPRAGEMKSSFIKDGNRQLAEDVIFDLEFLD